MRRRYTMNEPLTMLRAVPKVAVALTPLNPWAPGAAEASTEDAKAIVAMTDAKMSVDLVCRYEELSTPIWKGQSVRVVDRGVCGTGRPRDKMVLWMKFEPRSNTMESRRPSISGSASCGSPAGGRVEPRGRRRWSTLYTRNVHRR